jgi:hypothetical protein
LSRTHSPEFRAALVRLTTDPRMRGVWSYLTRKRRLTGQYLRPARVTLNAEGEAARRQNIALGMLFDLALGLAETRPRTVLRREIEARQNARKATAKALWAEANALKYLEELGERAAGRAKILAEAGCVLWQTTNEAPVGEIVVERDRGMRDVQAITMTLAGACCWLFGSPLYAVTAILVTVVLGRNVTARQVRKWGSISASAHKGAFLTPLKCRVQALD